MSNSIVTAGVFLASFSDLLCRSLLTDFQGRTGRRGLCEMAKTNDALKNIDDAILDMKLRDESKSRRNPMSIPCQCYCMKLRMT